MALIPCPKCGKQISSLAKKCPQCGESLQQGTPSNNVVCPECCNEYDKTLNACPSCGEPNAQFNLTEKMDGGKVELSQPTNEIEIGCRSCGAPVKVKSMEDLPITCPYCGSTIDAPIEQDDKETDVTLNDLSHAISDAIKNGFSNAVGRESDTYILFPKLCDKECSNKLVEQLVTTDLIPTDIFKSFAIENIHRLFYPVYVFDVNWTAQWSATFTKEVSHQEQTYDYNGRPNGTKTVWETLYRDANGTSAGDVQVVLPATSKSTPESDSIRSHFRNNTDEQKKLAEFDKREYEDWDLLLAELSGNEAWRKYKDSAENDISEDVDDVVTSDAWRMSDGWSVNRTHYTYNYNYGVSRCVLLPIWMAEYKYSGKSYGVSVLANDGATFLHALRPIDKTESEKIQNQEKEAKNYRKKQIIWYWVFGFFAAAAVTFFILLLSLGRDEYEWSSILSIICLGITFLSMFTARKFHQANLNAKNQIAQMLFDSKKKRAESAKSKYGVQVAIGNEPEKKNVSKIVNVVLYIVIIALITISVFAAFSYNNETKEFKEYLEETARKTELAETRAIGVYYFTKSQNIYRVSVDNNNTVTVTMIDSYDNSSYGSGYHRNEERKSQTGTWQVSDPSKNMDINISLSGGGLSLYDFRITDGVAYSGSSEIGTVITESQFDNQKAAIKSKYSNHIWEQEEYTGYGNEQSFTNRLELKSSGSAEISGRLYKTISGYDSYYGMSTYDRKNVTVSCSGRWEVVLISPDYGKTSNLLDDKCWGILLTVSKDADRPEWLRDMKSINDYSYGSESTVYKYLITDDSSVPLAR